MRCSREYLHHFVIIYIKGILIYSCSEADNHLHVIQLLQKLGENNLFLKLEKCKFHGSSMQSLGYIMKTREGRRSTELAHSHYRKRTATIPGLRKLLPPLHLQFQDLVSSSHLPIMQDAQVSVLERHSISSSLHLAPLPP